MGWSLSFSQYTRNYGLIISTAFSGAMICILGIDCFSRAGLKEFWLYIWSAYEWERATECPADHSIDLNKDVFPIHTSTYPITRGIRVEIAGTIVLFLFGVVSQIKVSAENTIHPRDTHLFHAQTVRLIISFLFR